MKTAPRLVACIAVPLWNSSHPKIYPCEIRAFAYHLINKLRGNIMTELNDCGCGRSPNGKCIGWHSLSEEEFQIKLKAYEAKQKAKK